MSFDSRTRMSWEDALRATNKPSPRIQHIVRNDDDTYSVVSHIVCEFCDYCQEAKDSELQLNEIVHTAKRNIYERVGR